MCDLNLCFSITVARPLDGNPLRRDTRQGYRREYRAAALKELKQTYSNIEQPLSVDQLCGPSFFFLKSTGIAHSISSPDVYPLFKRK